MTSKMIPVLQVSSSKEEELKALETMQECAGTPGNTYLSGLFSAELMTWVKGQINLDLNLDIMGELAGARKAGMDVLDGCHKEKLALEAELNKERYNARTAALLAQSVEGAMRDRAEQAEKLAKWQGEGWHECDNRNQLYRQELQAAYVTIERLLAERAAAEAETLVVQAQAYRIIAGLGR